jgi:ATP-dependent protease ClpP protease subunit
MLNSLTKAAQRTVLVAAALTAVGGMHAVVNLDLENRIYAIGTVDETLSRRVEVDVQNANFIVLPFEVIKLKIDSPGGEVTHLNKILDVLEHSKLNINTEVQEFAASAATVIFAAGTNRAIKSDAALIYHRARIQLQVTMFESYPITAAALDQFLKLGTLPSSNEAEDIAVIKKAEAMLKNVNVEMIKDVRDSLAKSDAKMIKYISDNCNISVEKLETEILKPLGYVKVTGEEAVKLGLATELL